MIILKRLNTANIYLYELFKKRAEGKFIGDITQFLIGEITYYDGDYLSYEHSFKYGESYNTLSKFDLL